jgi:NDP-4-keto-2,6-dideoxyhexose 3-C-methyltransferase
LNKYSEIHACRICGKDDLVTVLDLGEQYLTGVFPKSRDTSITRGPVQLVKCCDPSGCGLLQLAHSYDLNEMYGDNYGYRSGLNPSMVSHLHGSIRRIEERIPLSAGDVALDIGSNDCTTLKAYSVEGLELVGMDPSAGKFIEHYPRHVTLIEDFFSARRFREAFGDRKARVVTSFAMFYDLERPMDFMRQVHDILADDGIWVFEQSYMPKMLEIVAYDTVCQEHLEFYGLRQIQWMAQRTGFRIIDVELNDVNGGSFAVTMAKGSPEDPVSPQVQSVLDRERALELDTLAPYEHFARRVVESREELVRFVRGAVAQGKRVAALGASTKGNVLLQYCGFDADDIFAIGEVNEDKFGAFTPGTWVPIIPERELVEQKPDYVIVLPWHFRSFFLGNPRFSGLNLVFPLPTLEVIESPRPAVA